MIYLSTTCVALSRAHNVVHAMKDLPARSPSPAGPPATLCVALRAGERRPGKYYLINKNFMLFSPRQSGVGGAWHGE
ncbi:MAG: hypothetical protein Q7J98_05505 [Kiritimatiellia bacterium]|nr:hypothetical protein [Kiritimatiellia bacterium]